MSLWERSQLFMMDKYLPYKNIIREIRDRFYTSDDIDNLVNNIESYRKFIFISNNMSKVENLLERFKENDFKSPEELETAYKNSIEGVYIEMLSNMESWNISSNYLYSVTRI